MLEKLQKLNVRVKVGSGCACSKKHTVYTYVLPIRLDRDIVNAMKVFGDNVMNFNRTAMLKIETKDISIVAINKLKEIKLTFKNKINVPQTINRFEEALAAYIRGKKV